MAEDAELWARVHGEIADREEIDRLLFDLSERYRKKDTDTEEFRTSNRWCFGVRILRSWREAGGSEFWRHEFEMGFELRDALDLPAGATFMTVHAEEDTILANGGGLPPMYGVTINGFDQAVAALHERRMRLEQVYPILLIQNQWS